MERLNKVHQEALKGWPAFVWAEKPIRPHPPSRGDLFAVRVLAVVGAVGVLVLLHALLAPEAQGSPWFYWPIMATLSYRMLWWCVEWVYYARPKFAEHVGPRRPWTVDVLTTACPGEPRGMILRTLLAMTAIRYPHKNYLCDEGDDPVLKEACELLGVHHVTRVIKKHAKAGNINNALEQAKGEIVVVLDPDHEPAPFILDRVLGHFEDPAVGFVQSVQAYRNQAESYVADGSAKQTYLFYGPLMIGMNAYGTTQAIGANCVFRRSALDSIGGHAAGLSEDMHTTMQLYAKGWRSVYVPEILTRGLVPSSLSAYCKQQIKWACGSIELLLQEYPRLCRGMTHWQRLHYLLVPAYFLRGITSAIDIVVPILCLVLGKTPLRLDPIDFCRVYLPIIMVSALIRQRAQHWAIEESDRGAHFVGGLLAKGCWWVYLQGAFSAFLRIKLPYIPTPKESEIQDCWGLVFPNLIAATASVCAVVYGLKQESAPYTWMMSLIALANVFQLTWVSLLGQQKSLLRLINLYPKGEQLWVIRHCLETVYLFFHGAMLRALRNKSLVAVAVVVIVSVYLRPVLPRRLSEEEKIPLALNSGQAFLEDDLSESDAKAFLDEERSGVQNTTADQSLIGEFRRADFERKRSVGKIDRALEVAYREKSVAGYERAASLLSHELERFPNEIGRRKTLAFIYLDVLRSPQRALPHLKLISRSVPAEGDWWEMLARAQSATGDQYGAVESYRSAVQHSGRNAWLFYHLGRAEQHAGFHADAKVSFERALQLDPRNVFVRRELARCCLQTGQSKESEELARNLLSESSNDADAHAILGDIARMKLNFSAAKAEYRDALLVQADHPFALEGVREIGRLKKFELGGVYYAFKDTDGFTQSGLFTHFNAPVDERLKSWLVCNERLFVQGSLPHIRRFEGSLGIDYWLLPEWKLSGGGSVFSTRNRGTKGGGSAAVYFQPNKKIDSWLMRQFSEPVNDSYTSARDALSQSVLSAGVNLHGSKQLLFNISGSRADYADGNVRKRMLAGLSWYSRWKGAPVMRLEAEWIDYAFETDRYSSPGSYTRLRPSIDWSPHLNNKLRLELHSELSYVCDVGKWGTGLTAGLRFNRGEALDAGGSYMKYEIPGGQSTWSGSGFKVDLNWRF